MKHNSVPLPIEVDAVRPLGETVCRALVEELRKLGLEASGVPIPRFDQIRFAVERDPFSGRDSLRGEWLDGSGNRIGHLLFHADGSFWAEHDVVCDHPDDARWFVEAVTAWGREDRIKSEARLLPRPGE